MRPVLLLALLLAGCAGVPPAPRGPDVELAAVPFFPQQRYQCGPAALATVLRHAGRPVTPGALVSEVWLPGRRGSLQLELVAAVRSRGLVPYRPPPRLDALLAELRAGRPVLVLLNLGLRAAPVWHYAVVVGYRTAPPRLILRSGTTRRRAVPLRRFRRQWGLAGRWALVVLPPDRLPAGDDPAGYLRAVAGLEAIGQGVAAARAYRSALRRWPDQPAAWLGLGNLAAAAGRWAAAADHYRRALALRPGWPPAVNNLAEAEVRLGRRGAALRLLDAALARPDLAPRWRTVLRRTRAEVADPVPP